MSSPSDGGLCHLQETLWFIEADVAFVGPWEAVLGSPKESCELWMPMEVEHSGEVRHWSTMGDDTGERGGMCGVMGHRTWMWSSLVVQTSCFS